MIDIINEIKKEVSLLLNTDKSGHGMDHINRVINISLDLIKDTNIDKNKVILIAWLHDVDDYKLVGLDNSLELTNAKRILNKYVKDKSLASFILDSIKTIGYSKRLDGITPNSIESKIVSDADMLDAMGALGIVRSIEYNTSKNRLIFNSLLFPNTNLSSKEYKEKNDSTVINHVFEKLLKLKNLMLTDNAKEEANKRFDFMVIFLKEYFRELKLDSWLNYLDTYLNNL